MDIYYNRFIPQRLPLSKKDEKWRKSVVDSIIGKSSIAYFNAMTSANKKVVNYNLYNGIINMEDVQYVVNPYDVDDTFPAQLQNYNLVQARVNRLTGELLSQPDTTRVIRVGSDATNSFLDKKKAEYMRLLEEWYKIAQSGNEEMKAKELEADSSGKVKEIDYYMNYKYVDIKEMNAYNALEYLKKELNTKHHFYLGFKDRLICDEEIYYTGVKNGEPYLERVNPLEFDYDRGSPYLYIDKASWCVRRLELTATAIYDRYGEYMSEDDMKILDGYYTGYGSVEGGSSQVNYKLDIVKPMYSDTDYRHNNKLYRDAYIPVWHCEWISLKKVGFLTFLNNEGEEEKVIVDESYHVDKGQGESIEWSWVTEVWEGIRIGRDIYICLRPRPNQLINIDNYNDSRLSYTGINTNGISLVDMIKPYQYLYDIIYYRLELAMARDKGKVFLMDLTQIPKSMGISVEKWLHYLSSIGIGFVNPYEVDSEVNRTGRPSPFNQYQVLDLTMANVIGQYIQILEKIEGNIGFLTGISNQSLGQIAQNELVGNVNKSIQQGSYINKYMFYVHSESVNRAYTNLINTAQVAWADSDKKSISYITDDMQRISFDLDVRDFVNSNFAIYVNNSEEELAKVQILQGLVEKYMASNQIPFSLVADIINNNSIPNIVTKLRDVESKLEKAQQEQEKARQEQEQKMLKLQLDADKEKNRIIEQDSVRKSDTAIEIAYISNNSKLEAHGLSEDNKSLLEDSKQQHLVNKDDLDMQKHSDLLGLQQRQLDLKDKELQNKRILEEKKLQSSNNSIKKE